MMTHLGFGITFCSYDCAGMLLLRLWLEMSLVIAGWPPADIWLLPKLRTGLSTERTAGPAGSAAAAAATCAVGLLRGLGC